MNYKKMYCLKRVHSDLCRAIEKRWESQEDFNYGMLLGMRAFCDDESDEKLLNKIIFLYNHDRQAFLNFDFHEVF